MIVKRPLDARLRQYVLGELDDERRGELEERLIVEPDLFELLGPTEDELVEDYLENVLTPKEGAAFERHFLTNADRRWQLGFVRLMKEHSSGMASDATERGLVSLADPIVERRNDGATANTLAGGGSTLEPRGEPRGMSWARLAQRAGFVGRGQMWSAALAASLVVALAGTGWFVIRERSLGRELAHLRAEHELEQGQRRDLEMRLGRLTAQAQALQTEVEAERQQRVTIEAVRVPEQVRESALLASQAAPMFALATGLLRSGGSMARIAIPADAPLIRLRLELQGNDYPLYRAVIYDAQAEELWVQSQLTARADDRGAAVTITLPSKLLPRGDYQIILSGFDRGQQPERAAAYSVRVTVRR
jgi:hypothetical protein